MRGSVPHSVGILYAAPSVLIFPCNYHLNGNVVKKDIQIVTFQLKGQFRYNFRNYEFWFSQSKWGNFECCQIYIYKVLRYIEV